MKYRMQDSRTIPKMLVTSFSIGFSLIVEALFEPLGLPGGGGSGRLPESDSVYAMTNSNDTSDVWKSREVCLIPSLHLVPQL